MSLQTLAFVASAAASHSQISDSAVWPVFWLQEFDPVCQSLPKCQPYWYLKANQLNLVYQSHLNLHKTAESLRKSKCRLPLWSIQHSEVFSHRDAVLRPGLLYYSVVSRSMSPLIMKVVCVKSLKRYKSLKSSPSFLSPGLYNDIKM